MNLKSQIERLESHDLKALHYAIDQEQSYYILFSDSSFVGVHLTCEPQLTILQTQGVWSIGILKERS